jgi:hypothetical protein
LGGLVPEKPALKKSRPGRFRPETVWKNLFRYTSEETRTEKIFFGTLPAGIGSEKSVPVRFRPESLRPNLFRYTSEQTRTGKNFFGTVPGGIGSEKSRLKHVLGNNPRRFNVLAKVGTVVRRGQGGQSAVLTQLQGRSRTGPCRARCALNIRDGHLDMWPIGYKNAKRENEQPNNQPQP